MTNLKKTLAVVLAFAMILSMGFSAFAYTDVAEGTKVAEAVGVLSNLGIFTGFEDGTFKPDDTVTRAQMAAIICRTLGYEDQAQSSAGSTIFNDVPASHWASGYVNVAQSLQIINGYGDGNFGPEDQVTYEQAVKMIVVALGYELDAQAKGGWSTGYLAVASREGITKSANGTVGAPAARGTIAVLVYNSLEVRLMDQDTWTTNGNEDEFKKLNETILSKYLGVQKWEGVVAATPYSQYVGGYNPDDTPVVSLAPGCFYEEWRSGSLTKIYLEDSEGNRDGLYGIDCSLVDVNPYAGKKVIAYIGEEADEETGHRMVYAITEKSGANKVTTIGLNQLVDSGKYWDEPGSIAYKNVGSRTATDLDLDNSVSLVVNFAMVEEDMIDEGIDTTEELVDEIGTLNGTVSFISNDNDSKIDVIIVTAYTGEAVVEEVTTEDGVIAFDMYTNHGEELVVEEIDTEDEDALIIVYKDGALATVEDIAANDTISAVAVDEDGTFMLLYVSSKTITGNVEGYDLEYVTVAGEDYKLSNLNYSATDDVDGKEGIFFLNVAGQIAHDEAEAAKGNYGIVIAAGEGSGVKGGYEVEVVLADGTAAVYSLASKACVENADGDVLDENGEEAVGSTAIAAAKTAATVYDYLTSKFNGEDNARAIKADIDDLMFQVKIKNGAISKLTVLGSDGGDDGEEYDEENLTYGSVIFAESTVVFAVDPATDSADIEADDVKVGKVADFFVDGEGVEFDIIAYDVDDRDETAGAIIGFGLDTTVPEDGDVMIITSAKNISYKDDTAVRITGLQGGKEVTYTLYDEDDAFEATEFANGDIILVGNANAEGVISAYKSLFKYDTNGTTIEEIRDESDDTLALNVTLTEANEAKEIRYYAGMVAEGANAATDSTFTIVGGGEHIMKAAANYTLVDFTDGYSNIEVSKKSKGKSIFGTASKYDSAVFVRYYDDKIVEVVVYRWNEGSALSVDADAVTEAPAED